jgi:hypothetical protein
MSLKSINFSVFKPSASEEENKFQTTDEQSILGLTTEKYTTSKPPRI